MGKIEFSEQKMWKKICSLYTFLVVFINVCVVSFVCTKPVSIQ